MTDVSIDFKTGASDKDSVLIHIELCAENEVLEEKNIDISRELQPIDFNVIHTCIELFNEYNKNIIHKYDYTMVSETKCELILLFKHVFKKLNETRKFAYYDIELFKEERKIVFQKKMDAHPTFRVSEKADFLPIKNLVVFYKVLRKENVTTVSFDICYKKIPREDGRLDHVDLFQDMIKEMVTTTFTNMKKHISIENGEIKIV